MRYILFLSLMCLANSALTAQHVERERQAGEIKAAFANGSIKPQKSVKMILRDLSAWEGVVVTSGEDSFDLRIKKERRGHTEWTIPYKDILEIKSGNVRITFAPDVGARPYGGWEDVMQVEQNQNIGLILANEKEMLGRFGGATAKTLTLLGHTNDAVMEIPRESIILVYGFRDGSGGAAKGARKGMNIGRDIAPRPEGASITAMIGAGVGALAGLVNGRDGLLILVFSK